MQDFEPFQKIARLSRPICITEKIDGTNALIQIINVEETPPSIPHAPLTAMVGDLMLQCGSRTQWITPEKDNYGFAAWVEHNAEDLAKLGVGRHFGEWWGQGIQRNYGMKGRRFSLFNVSKWHEALDRPACCHCVPILGEDLFHSSLIEGALSCLKAGGSVAAPGFMNPEGIIIYHAQGNLYFKKTLCKDEEWKGKSMSKTL